MMIIAEFYNTYDMAQHDAYGDFAVTGRLDDAIRIKGVWLKIPTIESAVVSAVKYIGDAINMSLWSYTYIYIYIYRKRVTQELRELHLLVTSRKVEMRELQNVS